MTIAFLLGRLIFGLYWLMNAEHHLLHADTMVGYAGSKGVGSPKTAIIGSGILLLLGGLSMLLGWYPAVGAALLIIFLLGVSFKMHAYWNETDSMARMNERVAFMKNMALLGALLILASIPISEWVLAYSLGNWPF